MLNKCLKSYRCLTIGVSQTYVAIAPAKADVDAVHIATATVHGMDYLLTWNCKHIANAQIQGKLAQISLDFGYELPILCTPYELLGG